MLRVTTVVVLLAAVAAIAACDRAPTAPAGLEATAQPMARIEGDTLQCGPRGWVVIGGYYVCNGGS